MWPASGCAGNDFSGALPCAISLILPPQAFLPFGTTGSGLVYAELRLRFCPHLGSPCFHLNILRDRRPIIQIFLGHRKPAKSCKQTQAECLNLFWALLLGVGHSRHPRNVFHLFANTAAVCPFRRHLVSQALRNSHLEIHTMQRELAFKLKKTT